MFSNASDRELDCFEAEVLGNCCNINIIFNAILSVTF